MKIIMLITTALSVSLDSFFCGLSMSVKTKENFKFLTGISLSVFILCVVGGTLGVRAHSFFADYSDLVSGGILLIIALFGLLKKDGEERTDLKNKNNIFLESLIIGVAIGLDGAMGCLSLSLMGYGAIIPPIVITIIHLLLMNVAIKLTGSKIAKPLKKFSFTPYMILLALSFSKIFF